MVRPVEKNGTAEIAIDARWLHSGLGTYTYNLIARFPEFGNGMALRAIVRSENASRIAPFCKALRISNAGIYTLREQIEVPWAARGADLLHVPHYNVPVLYRGKLVVSILDLIHITDVEYRKRWGTQAYARTMLHIATRKASHIITISQFSKDQIVARLGVPASQITVIHCGVGPQFRPLDRGEARSRLVAARAICRPYLLYVGNLKPHKNLGRFLRAFAALRERNKFDPQVLIVTNDRQGRQAIEKLCSDLGIAEGVSFREDVTDELLPWVYAGAECLVMPSMIEGFGLPVLEAMACGTPVACSNAASLPEVGGDAVEYFDPNSVEDIGAAIGRVLHSGEPRAQWRSKALAQVARFSWDNSARRHCEVYRQVLGC